MLKTWIAGACLAATLVPALAEDNAAHQKVARGAYDVLSAVNKKMPGTQDQAMRRCRGYMDDAASAEKLGAPAMATKNWEKASRGCKQEALTVCRLQKANAPAAACEQMQR